MTKREHSNTHLQYNYDGRVLACKLYNTSFIFPTVTSARRLRGSSPKVVVLCTTCVSPQTGSFIPPSLGFWSYRRIYILLFRRAQATRTQSCLASRLCMELRCCGKLHHRQVSITAAPQRGLQRDYLRFYSNVLESGKIAVSTFIIILDEFPYYFQTNRFFEQSCTLLSMESEMYKIKGVIYSNRSLQGRGTICLEAKCVTGKNAGRVCVVKDAWVDPALWLQRKSKCSDS